MRTLLLAFLICALPASAKGYSWCARPLVVHEWGVQAFDENGRPQAPVAIPPWFHRASTNTPSHPSLGPPARSLAPDTGTRYLPVLHFYGDASHAPIPIGIEVGFAQGDATLWYPQVDARRPARVANSPAAAAERAQLLRRRAANMGFGGVMLPRDPTRQLFWDRLDLSAAPAHTAHASTTPWVDTLRGLDALWVNGATESERFVFYESDTRETPAIEVERAPAWTRARRHIRVHNHSTRDVYDVFIIHREGGDTFVVYAPAIPAGRSADFVLEDHQKTASNFTAATHDRLRASLVDNTPPPSGQSSRPATQDCVMSRDPAIPFETASGYQLYAGEVDALMGIWSASFFDRAGTTFVYRESIETLDAMMPLSLYTDMYHDIELRRAGLVVHAVGQHSAFSR